MWMLRVLTAVVALGLWSARAEPMLDLSAPQKRNFPSLVDLSGGNPASWRAIDKDYATVGPRSAHGSAAGGPAGVAGESRPKTQAVSGYTRKDGTYVKPYLRSSRR